jgi:hypothetical protein
MEDKPTEHRLGKEIKLSPNAKVVFNDPGLKITYHAHTVSLDLAIGKDHTALLIMGTEDWIALNRGEKINFDTISK